MPNNYTNLARLRSYLTLASQNTEDDGFLMRLIYQGSRSIDAYTRRIFYPRKATRFYDYLDPKQIRLDDDLLELTTLKHQNGACTVASGVLYLATGREWNLPPYDRIIIKSDSGSVLNYSGTPQRANEVTAIWGYHEDYANAWLDTGTSLAASVAVGDLSLSLAGAGSVGAGASDVNYEHPRLAVGDILKAGDEFMEVQGGGTSGNGTLIVRRGVNGTTAASYAAGASLARWSTEPDVEWCAIRSAAWLFGQKDSPFQSRQVFPELGTVLVPVSVAPDVRDRLDRFKRRAITVSPES